MQKIVFLCALVILVQVTFAIDNDPNKTESQAILDNRLIEAVKACDPIGIEEALKAGANPNITIKGRPISYSPVGYLFFFHRGMLTQKGEQGQEWSNFFRCLESLLEAGSSPKECCLMNMAAYHNWPSVIKLLAKYGFEPNGTCSNSLTPIEVAEQENHFLAQTALLSLGVSMLSESHIKHLRFIGYARDCNVPAMEDCFLPEEGFVNKPDRAGKYALLESAYSSGRYTARYSAISYLLLKGAKPNVQNDDGSSALHIVLYSSQYAFSSYASKEESIFAKLSVEALIKGGADLNLQDKKGKTPLHYAVEYDEIDAVILLLEAGAKNNIADNQRKVPADYATSNKMTQLFKIMGVNK